MCRYYTHQSRQAKQLPPPRSSSADVLDARQRRPHLGVEANGDHALQSGSTPHLSALQQQGTVVLPGSPRQGRAGTTGLQPDRAPASGEGSILRGSTTVQEDAGTGWARASPTGTDAQGAAGEWAQFSIAANPTEPVRARLALGSGPPWNYKGNTLPAASAYSSVRSGPPGDDRRPWLKGSVHSSNGSLHTLPRSPYAMSHAFPPTAYVSDVGPSQGVRPGGWLLQPGGPAAYWGPSSTAAVQGPHVRHGFPHQGPPDGAFYGSRGGPPRHPLSPHHSEAREHGEQQLDGGPPRARDSALQSTAQFVLDSADFPSLGLPGLASNQGIPQKDGPGTDASGQEAGPTTWRARVVSGGPAAAPPGAWGPAATGSSKAQHPYAGSAVGSPAPLANNAPGPRGTRSL